MPYNRYQNNEIQLAPGLDFLAKLEAMRGGPQTPTFYDETKQYIYSSATQRQFNMLNINLVGATDINPFTQRRLFERAYLCPYCALTNSLNVYHHKFNCNLDHQDPFATLISENVPPSVVYTIPQHLSQQQQQRLAQRLFGQGLFQVNLTNSFQFNWALQTHRQILYNDLTNLEITCHGHNRIKGDHLDREGTIGAALLLRLNRANLDVEED